MKIIKPKPKCADCKDWRIQLHCIAVILNGCNNYYCMLCWPAHAKIHEWDWEGLTDIEKQKIIERTE